MRMSAMIVAAALLSPGAAAWAAEGGAPGASGHAPGHEMKDGRMQGSPNAAGFGKDGDKGTTGPGASSHAPGHEKDGRMQGSPNAAGFKGGENASGAGERR